MQGYKPEITPWREHDFSLRHRQLYGPNCPATNIDFLEYDNARPVALIEVKARGAPIPRHSNPNLQAQRALADSFPIPFFIVHYALDFSWFQVRPENNAASTVLPQPTQMTETAYVTFLYALRKRTPPVSVLSSLSTGSV